MQNRETMLSNALIATSIPPSKPLISDIYTAIHTRIGPRHTPTAIMIFSSDYILQFPNAKSRDVVYSLGTLQGDGFTLTLQPWTTNYRSLTVHWNTKVTIQVKGIPPHAWHPHTLTPLLASHCDIETYHFNDENGICTINAFTSSIQQIPQQIYLGLPHQTNEGRVIHTYPINFETTAYTNHEDTSNTTSSSSTGMYYHNYSNCTYSLCPSNTFYLPDI
uniref:Uncharacterized protein n=1 Tax=Arundo donax TaxID=35708 RepID=A0A0A9GFT7_ARUDO